jgi:hypothetical protein
LTGLQYGVLKSDSTQRLTGDPLAGASGARALVRGVDRNPPIYDVRRMEQNIAWQTVTSYAVAQRTHEIGVRTKHGWVTFAKRRRALPRLKVVRFGTKWDGTAKLRYAILI